MSHPPIAHNPHVWADMGVHVNAEGNPVTQSAQEPIPVQVSEADGGEQPSANPAETTESAGTDSSESSSPGEKSDSSGGKPNRKAARNAGANSAAAATTDSFSAGSTAGAGTAP